MNLCEHIYNLDVHESYKYVYSGWTFKLSLVVSCGVAFAQTPTINPLLEQQGLKALQENRSLSQPMPKGSGLVRTESNVLLEKPSQGSSICFVIREVSWEGVLSLPQQTIQAVASEILDQCISTAKLNVWRTNLQKIYAQQGLIFAQILIPPQNIQSGSLRLRVHEGQVESIRHANKAPTGYHEKALKKFVGQPVNALTLDQELDQINRMPSMQSQAQLVPGEQVGGTVIEMQHTTQKPWRAQWSLDNRGSSDTGRMRSVLQLERDGLLGSNDTWFFSQINTSASRSSAMQVSAGQSYWTYGLQLSHSQYKQPPFLGLPLNGQSSAAGIWAERVLHRSPQSVWTAGLSFQHSLSKRSLGGITLTPYKTTPLRLETRYVTEKQNTRLSYELALQRGTSALGATRDAANLPVDASHAQYNKLSTAFSWQQRFNSTYMNSRLQAQWSKEQLYPGDQMSLGGFDAVRGLTEGSLLGHRGVMVRNEFSLPDVWGRGGIQPSITWDLGQVNNVGAASQSAMGAGFALKQSTSSLTWQLSLAKPLYVSASALPASDKKWRAYITASTKF